MVRTVAFSSDGKVLASGGGDNKIILWDPNKGECLKTLEGHRLAKLFFLSPPLTCLFCAIAVSKTIKVTILPAALPRFTGGEA